MRISDWSSDVCSSDLSSPAKSDVHMEDVHRAGGIMAILGQLERAGLLHAHLPTVHSAQLGDALNKWDISRTNDPEVQKFFLAGPGGVPPSTAFRQDRRWDSPGPGGRPGGNERGRQCRSAG